jgi:hypothetical protein
VAHQDGARRRALAIEAGVELPDGGTVDEWVVGLRRRMADLAAWRAFPSPGD